MPEEITSSYSDIHKKIGKKVKKPAIVMTAGTFSLSVGVISSFPIAGLMVVLLPATRHPNFVIQLMKVAGPTLPFAMAGVWLQGNRLGRSFIDGGKLLPILSSKDRTLVADDGYVYLALFANSVYLVAGVLFVHIVSGSSDPAILFTVGSVLGFFNYIDNLLTGVVLAFRKHAEYHQRKNHFIYSFLEQPIIKKHLLILHSAASISLVFFPVLLGFGSAYALTRTMHYFLGDVPLAARLLFALSAQQSTAYSQICFGMGICQDNFEAVNIDFSLNNSAIHSSKALLLEVDEAESFSTKVALQAKSTLLNMLGKLVSGEALLGVFDRTVFRFIKNGKLRTSLCVDVILVLSAITWSAIVFSAVTQFIISGDRKGIASGEKAKIPSFVVGKDNVDFGDSADGFVMAGALLLCAVGTFRIKRAVVHNHLPHHEFDDAGKIKSSVATDERDASGEEVESRDGGAFVVERQGPPL